jgi:hypothetical protein
MFNPTHFLVTRYRKTPVELIPSTQGFKIMTEIESQRGQEPAFEMRPKQGFFCQGISVVGYSLEPIATPVNGADGGSPFEPETTPATQKQS